MIIAVAMPTEKHLENSKEPSVLAKFTFKMPILSHEGVTMGETTANLERKRFNVGILKQF
jgi:hypothetical protein